MIRTVCADEVVNNELLLLPSLEDVITHLLESATKREGGAAI